MEISIASPVDGLVNEAVEICKIADRHGGKAFFVGGSVRDSILGKLVKDLDIEVYGIPAKHLLDIYRKHYRLNLVGKSFGVLKLNDYPIDISIPRRESKSGEGHRDFTIVSDEKMEYREACSRRDFTVNSILYDPLTCEAIDPFDGIGDIGKRVLKHCSEKFSEDPLRVLRLMRFSSTLDFDVADETVRISSKFDISPISLDRIYGEWSRMMVESIRPSRGMDFLRNSGLISNYPELEALIDCSQDSRYHPEGDVWRHTCLTMDMIPHFRPNNREDAIILGFAVMCHDLGKPQTTRIMDTGRITSYNHDIEGTRPTRTLMGRICPSPVVTERIIPLVRWHMTPYQLMKSNCKDSAIRRLASRTGRLDLLVALLQCDRNGRGQLVPEEVKDAEFILERAKAMDIQDKKPEPLIKGRHLIQRGLKPGNGFALIINDCFDAQLTGKFNVEKDALSYLDRYLEKNNRPAKESLVKHGK